MRKGDAVLVVFWARGKKAPQRVDDGAGAVVQPYLHSNLGNFGKGRVTNFYDVKALGEEWQRYYVKSRPLPMDFPPGTLSFVGMIGQKAQSVEVGGLTWMVFPEGSDLTKLPSPSWTYEGRAADAPWRAEAEQRINRYRKGSLAIEVTDAAGKPMALADVQVRMKQHAFQFGTAVAVSAFTGKQRNMTPEDREQYRSISLKYFNSYAIENDLKWGVFEAARASGWKDAKECVRFYHEQGRRVRGHVLVWPTIFRTPEPWRSRIIADKSALGEILENHIIEEASVFEPWISDWDVTNETQVNRDFMDTLGPEAMVKWYQLTRKVAPKAMLTFNEPSFGPGGMELGSFPESLLSDGCRGWVDYLIQKGAPLDSLGCQAHGGRVGQQSGGKTGPEGLWAYFDYLWSRYGKKLQYTELDVTVGNREEPEQVECQADRLRDSIIIAFAHPAFVGITQWGFWEGAHYSPGAALWTHDWKLTANGAAYVDLVYKRWWTNADLQTDAAGRCAVLGFYGDYEITVGGKSVTYRHVQGTQPLRVVVD